MRIATCAAFLLAAAAQSPGQEEPGYGGRVVIGIASGLAPLNPVITHSTASVGVFYLVFDRFLTESVDSEIRPGIARSWRANEDLTIWDFELRNDISFHDGHLLTAEDVVFTFELIKTHRPKDSWGNVQALEFDRVEARSPNVVRMHFAQPPQASFMYRLREHILPRHVLEPQLQTGTPIGRVPFNKHPIGSGPFKMAHLDDSHTTVELTAFEGHFRGRPYLDEVVVKTGYGNTQQLWRAFMKGEVEFVTRVSPEDLGSVAEGQGFRIVRGYEPAYVVLELNCGDSSVLKDRLLRRAVDSAISRPSILQHIGGNESEVNAVAYPTGPFDPTSPFTDREEQSHRLSEAFAQRLIERAGWSWSDVNRVYRKDGRILELVMLMPVEFPYIKQVAAQLRKDLGEIGIRLHIQSTPFAQLDNAHILKDARYDMVWTGSLFYDDPDLSVSMWHSKHPKNISQYASPAMDELIEQARYAFDSEERVSCYRQIHRLLRQDVPTVFVCRMPLTYAIADKLRGVELAEKVGPFRSVPNWYW